MDLHITAKSALPIGEPQGEFPVLASESMTVGMLIRTLCKDNGIRMKSSYTLRNTSQQELRWSSTLRENLVMGGAVLYLHDNAEEEMEVRGMQCNLWWYMSLISFVIGLIGLIAVAVLHYEDGLPYYSYGIVMDAGSSHTKMFIYKWNANKYNNTALAEQIHVCSVKGPGISSYELKPQDLAPPLRECLNEAETVIPKSKHSTTPIFLGATAGMRLIQAVNDTVSNAILTVVRNTISEYKYKFSFTDPKAQARIISGDEEGLFSWITSNYISGNFGVKPPTNLKDSKKWLLGATGQGTVGAMDLGGASTQITYFPGADVKMPKDYTSSRVLYGANFSVYTHSYLCYGINEITRKYKALLVKNENYSTTVTNPCGPAGNKTVESYTDVFEAPCTKDPSTPVIDKNTTFTFEGSSNTSQCLDTVSQLFNFSTPCPYGDHCSFNGTYQPPVYGKFYAFSNFFYEASFLNLTTNKTFTSLSDYETAVDSLCSKNWDQVKSMKVVDPEFLPWYCFRGNYMLILLRDAYKFNRDTWPSINFINKLSGTEIGWSLGFMIASSSHLPLDLKKMYLSKTSFALLIVLFIFFIIIAIGFGIFARQYHKLKKRGVYDKLAGYGTI